MKLSHSLNKTRSMKPIQYIRRYNPNVGRLGEMMEYFFYSSSIHPHREWSLLHSFLASVVDHRSFGRVLYCSILRCGFSHLRDRVTTRRFAGAHFAIGSTFRRRHWTEMSYGVARLELSLV